MRRYTAAFLLLLVSALVIGVGVLRLLARAYDGLCAERLNLLLQGEHTFAVRGTRDGRHVITLQSQGQSDGPANPPAGSCYYSYLSGVHISHF